MTRLTLDAAVEAAGQDGRPVLDRDPGLQVDFAAVGRVHDLSLGEDTAVDLAAEPEPTPAVAPIESDAAEPLVFRQLSHGDLEDAGFLVESQPARL